MKPTASQPDTRLLELCHSHLALLDAPWPDPVILTQDEVGEWPAGFLEVLEAGGMLTAHTPADRILCLGCEEACYRPIERMSGQRHMLICHLQNNMLPMLVEPERMQRWRLDHGVLAGKLCSALIQGGMAQVVLEGRIWRLESPLGDP